MSLAINICYGAAHVAFQKTKAGRKPSQNKKIAFKRISTDALMVMLLTVFGCCKNAKQFSFHKLVIAYVSVTF